MNRRQILTGTSAVVFTAVASRAFPQAATIPFPRELGMPPLPVPQRLAGHPNKFPVPGGFVLRVRAGCFCETRNVARDARVSHWQQDGTGPVQSVTAVYRNPNDTGVVREAFFSAVSTPTWITVEYPFVSELQVYKVAPERNFVSYEQRFNQNEGCFYIAYATQEDLLKGAAWQPTF